MLMAPTLLKTKTLTLPPILTMSVQVNQFPDGVKSAFNSIEKKLPSKNGRQFFGAVSIKNNEFSYKACLVQKEAYEHLVLGLDNYTIPGGKYVTHKLLNWTKNTHLIKEIFGEMEYKYRFDASRPQLEYYKSSRELLLMLPVVPREEQLRFDF